MTSSYSANHDKHFDQAWDTTTAEYAPETMAWLAQQKEEMQKGVHDTQLWNHWNLGRQGWHYVKGKQKYIGIASTLFSRSISLHSPSIHYNVYPFKRFTLSPFDKMLGICYPKFVHVHGNKWNHKQQPRRFKTKNLLLRKPRHYSENHGTINKPPLH